MKAQSSSCPHDSKTYCRCWFAEQSAGVERSEPGSSPRRIARKLLPEYIPHSGRTSWRTVLGRWHPGEFEPQVVHRSRCPAAFCSGCFK